jgi:uncharacterized protein DUF4360
VKEILMREMSLALVTALFVSACTAGAADPSRAERRAATAPVPEGAGFIESVEYAGTGCEASGVTSAFSPDKQVVTSIFSAFVAAKGGASAAAEAKKNCLLMMQINVPPGWSYALESVDLRGFAGLESEVTASRQALYMIAGIPVHVTPRARWKGTFNEDYAQEDVGPKAPGPWSPCGGGQVLWIATQLEVSNSARPSRSGQLTVDTIDTELQWRRCQ